MNNQDKKLMEWAEHMCGIKESPRLKKMRVTNHGVGLDELRKE